MEYYSALKEMRYQAMKRHGGNLNAYFLMIGTNKSYLLSMISWKRKKTMETVNDLWFNGDFFDDITLLAGSFFQLFDCKIKLISHFFKPVYHWPQIR